MHRQSLKQLRRRSAAHKERCGVDVYVLLCRKPCKQTAKSHRHDNVTGRHDLIDVIMDQLDGPRDRVVVENCDLVLLVTIGALLNPRVSIHHETKSTVDEQNTDTGQSSWCGIFM